MKKASISEAKNQLSALVDRVKSGASVLIVDRGRPVARLEPVGVLSGSADQRVAGLIRAGIVRPRRAPLPEDFFERPLPRPAGGVSALQALLEERREGR